MAATGKTPILLYGSTTPTNAPVAGNLTNSSDGCEIAINVADKNLFFKDSSNNVNTVPIRQSSASSNGWLSSTDWSTFNNKQPAGTYVTSVTGTAPVVSSGGTTPAISMAAANGSTNGYLTSTDWTTFNGKAPSFTYTTGYIPFGQGTTTPTQSANLFWDNANASLGISTATPATLGGVVSAVKSAAAVNIIPDWAASTSYTGGIGVNVGFNGSNWVTQPFGANGAAFVGCGWGSGELKFYTVPSTGNTVQTISDTTFQTYVRAKIDATGNFTVTNGNLVIGTSGKGIDFSVTSQATGMTSELLADYEEGTFTATASTNSGVIGTWTAATGTYRKVGNLVYWQVDFSGTNIGLTAGTGYYLWTGLPYVPAKSSAGSWVSGVVYSPVAGAVLITTSSSFWLYASGSSTTGSGITASGVYET